MGHLPLLPAPDRKGELEGRFEPTRPGLYEVRIPDLKGAVPARFEVREPGQEDPGPMAENALKSLARAAGGTYHRLDDAAKIPGMVEEATEILVTDSRPQPLWDNLVFLCLAVALLALEWTLRKWMNLP